MKGWSGSPKHTEKKSTGMGMGTPVAKRVGGIGPGALAKVKSRIGGEAVQANGSMDTPKGMDVYAAGSKPSARSLKGR